MDVILFNQMVVLAAVKALLCSYASLGFCPVVEQQPNKVQHHFQHHIQSKETFEWLQTGMSVSTSEFARLAMNAYAY